LVGDVTNINVAFGFISPGYVKFNPLLEYVLLCTPVQPDIPTAKIKTKTKIGIILFKLASPLLNKWFFRI